MQPNIQAPSFTDQSFLQRLLNLCEQIVGGCKSISNLSILTACEREQLLFRFNHTALDYQTPGCLHHLITAQAIRTPTAQALYFNDAQLSYWQLNTCSNYLALMLQQQFSCKPNSIIGVCSKVSKGSVF